MARVIYVNGRYLAYQRAKVHVEDRGYQFSDSVYEVFEVWNGYLVELEWHLDRLYRSIECLDILFTMSRESLLHVVRRIVRLNYVVNGHVYIQVTRGVSPRQHGFPNPVEPATIVIIARHGDIAKCDKLALDGVSVVTCPDIRWGRVDLKTTALLPNVLAKETAFKKCAGEAWFVDKNGYVTEGSACNAWIVGHDGTLITRPVGHGDILPGVTRKSLIFRVAPELGLRVEERAFTVEEAQNALEAFNTAAIILVMPVTSVDGIPIGSGCPGDTVQSLRSAFHRFASVTKV